MALTQPSAPTLKSTAIFSRSGNSIQTASGKLSATSRRSRHRRKNNCRATASVAELNKAGGAPALQFSLDKIDISFRFRGGQQVQHQIPAPIGMGHAFAVG